LCILASIASLFVCQEFLGFGVHMHVVYPIRKRILTMYPIVEAIAKIHAKIQLHI